MARSHRNPNAYVRIETRTKVWRDAMNRRVRHGIKQQLHSGSDDPVVSPYGRGQWDVTEHSFSIGEWFGVHRRHHNC